MLEGLFGNGTIEKILFFLIVHEKCFAKQLADRFESSISPFQRALDRLENGGIVVSQLEGKTRNYKFNPRYPFLYELKALIAKSYEFLPGEMRKKYFEPLTRTRPRKRNKP